MRLPPFATAFHAHATFTDLAKKYDGFILDQFGVLHNGKDALPGAVDLVKELVKTNKKLIILSNTSSPAKTTMERLPGLGFSPDDFVGAVTSGQEASRLIKEKYGSGPETKRFVWFTWAPGNTNAPPPLRFVEECGNVEPARSVEEADFVIAHGSGVVRGPGQDGEASIQSMGSFFDDGDLTEVDVVLQKCKERNLPLICANPDFVVMYSDGAFKHMPGKIAKRYEESGGETTYFGKPHAAHFEACIRELGLDRERVAHVGDSLHHDIAGANNANVPSIFVCGGIHKNELGGMSEDGLPDEEFLNALFEKENTVPTHVVPMFRL
jgi:HAD superfamily hydrolase (TIGR01450 family)